MQDSTRKLVMHQLGQRSKLEPFCSQKVLPFWKINYIFWLIIWIKYIYNGLIWLRDCKTIITCIIKIDIVRCLWIKYIKKPLFNVGVWEARCPLRCNNLQSSLLTIYAHVKVLIFGIMLLSVHFSSLCLIFTPNLTTSSTG